MSSESAGIFEILKLESVKRRAGPGRAAGAQLCGAAAGNFRNLHSSVLDATVNGLSHRKFKAVDRASARGRLGTPSSH